MTGTSLAWWNVNWVNCNLRLLVPCVLLGVRRAAIVLHSVSWCVTVIFFSSCCFNSLGNSIWIHVDDAWCFGNVYLEYQAVDFEEGYRVEYVEWMSEVGAVWAIFSLRSRLELVLPERQDFGWHRTKPGTWNMWPSWICWSPPCSSGAWKRGPIYETCHSKRFFKRVVLHSLLCATVVLLIVQKIQFTLVMMSCSNNSWRLQAQQSTNQLAAATLVAAAVVVVVVVAAVAAGLAASSRSRWPLWSVTILVECYWDISPIQQCTDSDQCHYISMISLTFW